MSAWWLLLIPGVSLYVAGALVTFGWMTCGGDYRMPSDYVWATVWPVSRLRGVGWAIRRFVFRHHWVDGVDYYTILGVPPQRIDRWLMAYGQELAIKWQTRNEEATS